jgi:DNA adenine methylase
VINRRLHKIQDTPTYQKIAAYADRIHLTKLDAIDFINNRLPLLPAKTFIYLDPPYYVKGEGLYENHYKHNDHELVSKAIASIQDKSRLVSYDNVPAICKLYE